MRLFFSPLSCSLASRITLYETGQEAAFEQVDTAAGRTASGEDYRKINPKGLVPALQTDEGEVLTENVAVLQYLSERKPDAGLVPQGFDRYRLQQWLGFIASELHKHGFTPLFSRRTDEPAKALAREALAERFAILDAHLTGREWILDSFSVADAYLCAVINWAQAVNFDLAPYPAVIAWRDRARARPAVAKALGEELSLYRQAA